MDELFGIPTATIAFVTGGLFILSLLTVLGLFLKNRTMVKMGLRNIPRRGTQTILVVVGLMLATLIVTAAFSTGDTVNYSISQQTYSMYGHNDLDLTFGGTEQQNNFGAPRVQPYVNQELVAVLDGQFAGDPDIIGVVPFLVEQVPAVNSRTRLAEPAVVLNGFDPQRLSAAGGLKLTNGSQADLTGLTDSQALVSKRAAGKLDAKVGDTLTFYANGQEYSVEVVGIVENTLASGVRGFGDPNVLGGIAMPLPAVQAITDHQGEVNIVNIALTGAVRGSETNSDAVAARVQSYLDSPSGQFALEPLVGDTHIGVEKSKQDAVEQAEKMGNTFTMFFLVMGLFSVAAGIMLIFMIFIMLAAERKPEMGMARAVGAQRGNLVQSFVAEGMAYSLLAGLLGAVLGVGAAAGLVVGLMRLAGGDSFSFVTAHFTPTSIVIGYTLGVVITFATVVFASLRASHLNIVAAIRGTDEEAETEARRGMSWKAILLSLPLLVIPPLGLWLLLRKGLGLPKAWIWGPLGLVSGALLMLLGKGTDSLFLFATGISLLPLSAAALAGYYRAPRRLTWSLVGILLSAYWLMPASLHTRLFGDLSGNIEMFVISGVMIVIAFTVLIVFNARLLTTLFERSGDAAKRYRATLALGGLALTATTTGLLLGDTGNGLGAIAYLFAGVFVIGGLLAASAARFPRLAPAMKMAVAYPLANRFRTGMTVAMFSLIIFSLTTFSVINANFEQIFLGDDASGGIAIIAQSNPGHPVGDLKATLARDNSPAAAQITGYGNLSISRTAQEVRQPGKNDAWQAYSVVSADDNYFGSLQPKLDSRANGYADDQAVLDAVRSQPNLALIDSTALATREAGDERWRAEGVTVKNDQFTPFPVQVRDPISGQTGTVTVIGVLSGQMQSGNIYLNEATYRPIFGTPEYGQSFAKLVDGADAELVAKQIKSALLEEGVQAHAVTALLDEASAESKVFTRMFQGFMALGLFVGVAALGVIAFRSVVERRQQIGMLRAIGYQTGTVGLTFVLESCFIAVIGILSGVVGATILSRNLMSSDSFNTTGSAVEFFVPWSEVLAFVAIAFVFSLLMTWWPSRGASRIEIAEALRYE
jgi:putative ABC transport system permease protein